MKPVFLASPLSAPDTASLRKNLAYARRAMKDSISRGEAPFVPHLLYPLVLRDDDPEERSLGMSAGNAWLHAAEAIILYADLGISTGMNSELQLAIAAKIPVEIRYIKGAENPVKPSPTSPTQALSSPQDGLMVNNVDEVEKPLDNPAQRDTTEPVGNETYPEA